MNDLTCITITKCLIPQDMCDEISWSTYKHCRRTAWYEVTTTNFYGSPKKRFLCRQHAEIAAGRPLFPKELNG